MAEHVEQRGDRWYARYKDNPGDSWSRRGPFATRAEAQAWLENNPAVDVDVDDEDDRD